MDKELKRCPHCGVEKHLEDFYPAPSRRDGRSSYCKLCSLAYERKWQQDNREKRNKYRKSYQQVYRLRIKSEVLTHYGNNKLACVKCGFNDIRALSLDHTAGAGGKHRRTSRMKDLGFYLWLKRNNYPEGYQTLCMNCQWIKRVENGECNKGR